jgi:molecular chaperone DnaK (HSP70)
MAALLAFQQEQEGGTTTTTTEGGEGEGRGNRLIVVFDLGHAHLDVAVVEEDERVRGWMSGWVREWVGWELDE